MNDQFKAQKEILVSLKHEISLLHQQVDYLIRNEKSLGLLDLDVMMNRTHTIYDRLCSINVGNPPSDNEEMDINPEMLNALFGMDDGEDEEEYYEDPDEEAETPAQEEVPTEKITDTLEGNDQIEEDKGGLDQVEEDNRQLDDIEEREDNEIKDNTEENVDFEEENVIEDKEENDVIEEEPVKETGPTPSEEQDYGFIFKMEPDEPEQADETIEPEQPTLFNAPEQPELFNEPEQAELFNEPEQPELSPEEKKSGFYTSGDEIEMEIPHFDFPMTEDNEITIPEEEENDLIEEEENDTLEDIIPTQEEESDLFEEEEADTLEEEADSPEEETEPFEDVHILETEEPEPQEEESEPQEEELEPQEENMEEEPEEDQDYSDDIAYEPIIFGNMEEKDDMGFEFEPVETLGDKLQHEDNNTVAAMLQNQASRNLRSSIGINDKFLFVNELFGGSMEKYNRSIGNLDDLKTLNGALIYLNELRIDLQWNSNNEAYKKLLEIVHHKFE